MITDPAIRPESCRSRSRARPPDPELLLFDWLNALVYEMAIRRLLFSRFEVKVEGPRLTARAFGEPVAVDRHEPAVEVKGATCTGLAVARPARLLGRRLRRGCLSGGRPWTFPC